MGRRKKKGDEPRRGLAVVFSKILLLAKGLGGRRPARWAMPVILPSSDNCYAVDARVFRSAQPTAEAFVEYERLGIKTIIQLRPDDDDGPLLGGTALKLVTVPMRTWRITDEHVVQALKAIRDEAGPMLIHCRHGADRTGVVMAMYRVIFHGWPLGEAMEEMLEGGYGFHHKKRQNIVEYLHQVDLEKIRSELDKRP